MDLEVVWNGDIRGANRGLLQMPAHETHDAPPMVGIDPHAPLLWQLTAALAEWRTQQELAVLLSEEPKRIERGLRQLRDRGALEIGRTGNGNQRRYRLQSVRKVAA